MIEKLNQLIKETMLEIVKSKKENNPVDDLYVKLETYKSIKSTIINLKSSSELPELKGDPIEFYALKTLVKSHEKSIEAYKEVGRKDLEDYELKQLKIIKSFLPEEATTKEIAEKIGQYIEYKGFDGNIPKSKIGECITYVKTNLAPKSAEPKTIITLMKDLLL